LKFTGDYRGEVAIRFTTEALESFLDLLNESNIAVDRGGLMYRVEFSATEYQSGEVVLNETIREVVPA